MNNKYFCSVLLALLLLMNSISIAAEEQVETDEAADPAVTIYAENELGFTICEWYLWTDEINQWACAYSGDPLTLKHPLNISEAPIPLQPELACPPGADPELVASVTFSAAVLKHPGCTRTCPWPLYPEGQLFSGVLSNGMEVFLRIAESEKPAIVKARMLNEVIDLQQATPKEVAYGMMTGEYIEANNFYIEDYLCIQQCKNIIAFDKQENQLEELMNSAELTARLCEKYKERNGKYPMTLCQLYTSTEAIVGAYLNNPYRIDESLCVSDISEPKPLGALRYIPEVIQIDENPASIHGFWIAVLGKGESAEPIKPLPAEVGYPMRAVGWFEDHPDLGITNSENADS